MLRKEWVQSCQKQEELLREEKPLKSDHALQLNAEGKTHSFQFRIRNGEINKVVCDASKTVFGALNENGEFQSDKEGKEIIIRRSKEQNYEAAVKTDFPCCLIEDDETLQINFYSAENIASNQETTTDTDPKSLVTFYIRTRGMTKKIIMKGNNVVLDNNIDYVCVFAHKGDTIEKTLQHDGRFSDDIFDKVCKLVDDEKNNHSISLKVDCCDGKKFELNVKNKKKPQAPVLSDMNDGESVKHSQQPKNTKQKTIQDKKTKSTDPSTEGNTTQNTSGNSSGYSIYSCSTEIAGILQTQCKMLFEMLQNPNPKIKELYQEEFDKSLQSFTDVKNVRWLMDLSDSVCLIRFENSPRGTGFLLFDRFILTNAHVVQGFVHSSPEAPHTHKLSRKCTALFNYEDLESVGKVLPVKDDVVAYGFENKESHDFALLELEAAPYNCTELLERCKHGPSPNSGGIYIVGHPDCGVKKMDPCFIIEIENRLQSIKNHISENVSCPYVSWQCWSGLRQNTITYDSCFFHGSSGSPVFDEHCYLIGMHTGGFHYKNAYTGRSVIEYSVFIQSIIKKIHTQVKTRSDVFDLFSKFEYVKNITSGEHMPVRQDMLSEVEDMDES